MGDTFEVLRSSEQFKALHLLTTKPLDYYKDEQKPDKKE